MYVYLSSANLGKTNDCVQYFGTMAGVRGFNDPNVQVNPDGLPVWYQSVCFHTFSRTCANKSIRQVDPDMSNATTTLLPWYLGYQGGNTTDAIQCMAAGDNGYEDSHASLNGGLNNHWARNNTPWSWGYFKREDIPVHYAIAEGWTTGDMYQVCSAITLSKLCLIPYRSPK